MESILALQPLAHARRKLFDLHSQNQSQIAGEALDFFGRLYDIEREVGDLGIDERCRICHASPSMTTRYAHLDNQILRATSQTVADGVEKAKAELVQPQNASAC